jgi:hypothetical protein
MGDFGNGVEQFSEHFQVRCRVSLLIVTQRIFSELHLSLPTPLTVLLKSAPGQNAKYPLQIIYAINKLSILSFLWHRMQNITHGI